MDKKLEGKEYIAGKFSIADAALFYVEFWASARMKMTLPKNCARPLRADEEPSRREARAGAGRPRPGGIGLPSLLETERGPSRPAFSVQCRW